MEWRCSGWSGVTTDAVVASKAALASVTMKGGVRSQTNGTNKSSGWSGVAPDEVVSLRKQSTKAVLASVLWKKGKKTINQESIKAPETGITPDEVASLRRKRCCSGWGGGIRATIKERLQSTEAVWHLAQWKVAPDVVRNQKKKTINQEPIKNWKVVSLRMRWCRSGCGGHPESIKKEALDAVGIRNELKKKTMIAPDVVVA